MSKPINLGNKIEKQLPIEVVEFLESAGLVAANLGWSLYLVGGIVRDLLLGRSNPGLPIFSRTGLDIDLVVEGDAIALAKLLAENTGGKLLIHLRFGTAKLKWDEWNADLAMARTETYSRPGALPTVKPSLIVHDLFRRDFTVNAMAVELIPGRWGQLIDPYGGLADLKDKKIRILHENSFIDDATRIWRAIRYEQRFAFSLERNTLRLLNRDIRQFSTISGDRIRHELERVLKEAEPEKVLRRADGLGVLAKLHPKLKGNDWLAEKFQEARRLIQPGTSIALNVVLLTYPLTKSEIESLISYLHFPKPLAQTLRDSCSLKTRLKLMSKTDLRPSRVYELLYGYSEMAITALSLATESPTVRRHIELFLARLRYVKPSLTGEDLKKLGIPASSERKEILHKLLLARLNGQVNSGKEEEKLVRG